MKLLDLIYYLSYTVYVRGNKDTFGAFFMSSLWISALQFFWIIILMTSLELLLEMQFILYVDVYLVPFAIVIFLILMIINNIYISKRKKILLERFSMSKKKEMLYFLAISVFFFFSFAFVGYMSFLRKEMFGY